MKTKLRSLPQLFNKVDTPFLTLLVALVLLGFFIFVSASLGIRAQQSVGFLDLVVGQFLFGVIGGSIALVITTSVHYSVWKEYAFWFFLASVIATCLVFVPGLGYEHAGATRWISLGAFSFQPAEFLKIGFVIYFAGWLSSVKSKISQFKYGLLPMGIMLVVVAIPLLLQPDTGTLLVIGATAFAMFIAAGARWRDIFAVMGAGLAGLAALAIARPYVRERLLTFFDPSADPLGAGYQLRQSLIAVGSGQWFGRGMGQSVQKFNFLPEPIGDSIFAVFAEEWGFVGALVLIVLFLAFALRGYKIASGAPNQFTRLLVTGLVTSIVAQSFVNIAAMIGIIPLSGMPLIFVSHGGSALLIALASVGIILGVSRYARYS